MRNNLPKIKDGALIINLDEYNSMGTHCIALYVNDNNVTYFESFGVEHIPKEIERFMENENIECNQITQCVDTFVLDLLIYAKR